MFNEGYCVHGTSCAMLGMRKHGNAADICSAPENAADIRSAPGNLQMVIGSASGMGCTSQHTTDVTKIGRITLNPNWTQEVEYNLQYAGELCSMLANKSTSYGDHMTIKRGAADICRSPVVDDPPALQMI